MDMHKLEIIIQLCRMQIQREREKLMTPKFMGVASALAKLKSEAEDEAVKLMTRVEGAGSSMREAFKKSHGVVGTLESGVKEIEDFVVDLNKTNGGDPLERSEDSSNVVAHPRSSEVAQK